MPSSELQFITPEPTLSHPHSRATSQSRRQQNKSHSRQHSHTRTTSRQNPRDGNFGRNTDSRGGSGDISSVHSRAESAAQSLSGSVQSSPKIGARGRSLPLETQMQVQAAVAGVSSGFSSGGASASANQRQSNSGGVRSSNSQATGSVMLGRSGSSGRPISVFGTIDATIDPSLLNSETQDDQTARNLVVDAQPQLPAQDTFHGHPQPFIDTLYHTSSQPHSQSHSPYGASPSYHPPQGQGPPFGGSPVRGAFNLPAYPAPPIPPQQSQPLLTHQPYGAYMSYMPLQGHGGMPPVPMPSHPYAPYMYSHIPYGYYAPMPAQLPQQGSMTGQEGLPQQDVHSHMHTYAYTLQGQTLEQPSNIVAPSADVIQASPNLPPQTLRTRPPPPGQSGPLSGYRDISAVPVSPLLNASLDRPSMGSAGQLLTGAAEPRRANQASQASLTVEEEKGMVFGSVGRPGGVKSPSPVPRSPAALDLDLIANPSAEDRRSRTFTAFSIGMKPGEAGPSMVKAKSMSRHTSDRQSEGASNVGEEVISVIEDATTAGKDDDSNGYIDLTNVETKLQFGTSSQIDEPLAGQDVLTDSSQVGPIEVHAHVEDDPVQPQPQPAMPFAPSSHIPIPPSLGYNLPPSMHVMHMAVPMPSSSPQPPNQPLPHHIPSLTPLSLTNLMSPLNLNAPPPQSGASGPSPSLDDFEVHDFGYGFGPLSGSGYMPERIREQRIERERSEREVGRDRDFVGFVPGRSRRNSNANGYGGTYEVRNGYEARGGYENRGGYEVRGAYENRGGFEARGGHEGRGGYEGRGYERGFARRGRGYGRGYHNNRGGFANRGGGNNFNRHVQQQQQQQQQNIQQQQPSPLSVTSPPFQPLHQAVVNNQLPAQSQPVVTDIPNGYYGPAPSTSYDSSSPYGQYYPPPPVVVQPQAPTQPFMSHPPPAPITKLEFPLDQLRSYLLGQLEYYFGQQNLAKDFYLRQQVRFLQNIVTTA